MWGQANILESIQLSAAAITVPRSPLRVNLGPWGGCRRAPSRGTCPARDSDWEGPAGDTLKDRMVAIMDDQREFRIKAVKTRLALIFAALVAPVVGDRTGV
jgi:hypothetical protein